MFKASTSKIAKEADSSYFLKERCKIAAVSIFTHSVIKKNTVRVSIRLNSMYYEILTDILFKEHSVTAQTLFQPNVK